MASNTEGKYTEEEVKKIKECPLHANMYINPGGLWYSANSSGYSTYSPPCNGCKMGCEDRDRGLWMSGFVNTKNEKDQKHLVNYRKMYQTSMFEVVITQLFKSVTNLCLLVLICTFAYSYDILDLKYMMFILGILMAIIQ